MNTRSFRSLDRHGYYAAWGFIITFALLLRLWMLPGQLLADDEWHALNQVINVSPMTTFISFGYSDHSIPMTLFYFLLSAIAPLTETMMRLPMMLAGMASIIVIPWLLRALLAPHERLLLGALLAISPLLIYYSRTARPYAISTLLVVIAIVCFYCWFRNRQIRHAAVYVLCAATAAWLLPVNLPILLMPFIFFGVLALNSVVRDRQYHDIKALFLLGLVTLIPLLVLLGPPVYFSLGDISSRAGVHTITLSTLMATVQLLVGSKYTAINLIVLFLIACGVLALMRRNRLICLYLITCSMIAFLVCIASGAAWIHHPLVVARYILPVLPFLLLFVSIGASSLAQRFLSENLLTRRVSLIAVPVVLATFGPLWAPYLQPQNQFTGHMAYQFDYDWETNVYNDDLDVLPIADFYHQLSREEPGEYHLAIAPWFIQWHWNRWYLDQRIHQQRVSAAFLSGFCGSSFYGEYEPARSDIDLQHVIHLVDLVAGEDSPDNINFLVYQKTPARSEIDYRPFKGCLTLIRATFGDPHFEDEHIVVFRLAG